MAKSSSETFVLSLGGSLINPDGRVDDRYLGRFRSLILAQVKLGRKFAIICGGGSLAREYQRASSAVVRLTSRELDLLGIEATRMNGHLVRTVFRDMAHPEMVLNPTLPLRVRHSIVVSAGWKPGCSSDYEAVLLAKKLAASTVINLTNIDYVYDRDPKRHPDARPLKEMGWKEYRKLVGSKWVPGSNLPFDPVASKLAHESGLRVIIADGGRLDNLKKILDGDRFRGTVIGE
ncbi:MAG: UMP kinase [bacterium]